MREILHFNSEKEKIAYLKGEFKEVIPAEVQEKPIEEPAEEPKEEPKEEKAEEKKPAKKAKKSSKKGKTDEVQAE